MKKLIIFLVLLSTCFAQAQKADVAESKDYDLFGRLDDFFILNYEDFEFGSHEFLVNSDREGAVVEGRKIVIRYEHQNARNSNIAKPSYLQILRNYSSAINKAGGDILYEHRNADYGYYFLKTTSGKEVWLEVKAAPDRGRRYTLTILERELMVQDIVIDADLMKDRINIEGKIAIYGIHFDVGKSVIKPESRESLEQIALFLKDNPTINCWVVGHTDSDGSFELNSKLSLARAEAIVAYLQSNHSIASARLFAQGVGPLAPLSTNTTEEGKKLNRRVEFVKK